MASFGNTASEYTGGAGTVSVDIDVTVDADLVFGALAGFFFSSDHPTATLDGNAMTSVGAGPFADQELAKGWIRAPGSTGLLAYETDGSTDGSPEMSICAVELIDVEAVDPIRSYESDALTGNFSTTVTTVSGDLVIMGVSIFDQTPTNLDGTLLVSDVGGNQQECYVIGKVATGTSTDIGADMTGDRKVFVVVIKGAGGGVELTVDDATHGQAADSPALTQAHTLAVQAAAHAQAVDNVVLDLGTLLEVADALHAHAADAPTLVQSHILAVADALHAQASDGDLALVQGWVLSVDDETHAQTADSPGITQAHVLVVADAAHGQSADGVELVADDVLVVADALHAQVADAPELVQSHLVAVADALHAHAADGDLALVQGWVLAPDDALHGQGAESPTLTLGVLLTVGDALHGHTADALDLVPSFALVVQDASHSQSADGVDLVQAHVLAVDDAVHAHSADTVVFVVYVPLLPPDVVLADTGVRVALAQ